MGRLAIVILLAPLLGGAAVITDDEIRKEASRLVQAATAEPPLFGLETMLQTATLVRPYVQDESQRIYRVAVAHGARHRDIGMRPEMARMWLELDPSGGEQELLKFNDKRQVLAVLAGYYRARKDSVAAAKHAEAAARMDAVRLGDTGNLLRMVAEHSPGKIPELLRLPHVRGYQRQGRMLEDVVDGLAISALQQPEAVRKVVEQLRELVDAADFSKDPERVTTTYPSGGREVQTADTKSTLLASLDLVKQLTADETRAAAQESIRKRSQTYTNVTPGPKPVDGALSSDRAIEEIRKREPAYQQIGELWRYLQGKPRTAEEAKAILNVMFEWSAKATDKRSDPAWFSQSLLNLDGRLGPPGRGWVLPKELRPMVFVGAARIGQQQDNAPEQFNDLALAFEKEHVDVPEDLPSVRNRLALAALRGRMESRYSFSLPGVDGSSTELRSLRGKVVLINFWASWCMPCRAELPALERLSKEFPKEVQILAITDDKEDALKGFLEKNPVALRVLRDQQRETFRHYNVVGLPQTFVLDAEGTLRQHFRMEAPEAELRAAILTALGRK